MSGPLKGKIAVVTGSANGIGRACAERLAKEGADVAILDIEAGPLAEVADSLKQYGNRVLPIRLDLTDRPLVVDAFGEDGMPAKFKTAAFFKLAKSRMKPRGALFLMNVIVDDDDDQTPDRMVRLLRRQWSKVRLLDTDGWVDRNAVIAAGSVAKLRKPKLMMPPRTGAKKLKRELAVLDWRTLRNKVGR